MFLLHAQYLFLFLYHKKPLPSFYAHFLYSAPTLDYFSEYSQTDSKNIAVCIHDWQKAKVFASGCDNSIFLHNIENTIVLLQIVSYLIDVIFQNTAAL